MPEPKNPQDREARERERQEAAPSSPARDPKLLLAMGLAAAAFGVTAGAAMKGTEPAAPKAPKKIASSVMGALQGDAESPIPLAWDLPAARNDQVDFFIEYLVEKKSKEMREWLGRAGTYGPLIRDELRQRGMPEDLFYLAMIESGLNPDAYSSAHAAGIWQFIPETGRRYGLEVSTYVDERRDPIKSTQAALTYLQELHERFDSWFLAAASYNTGENRVGRIMREEFGGEKGDDANYWRIGARLPRETRDYVPLMLAAAHISKHADDYGLADAAFEQPLAFETVEVPGGTKLAAVAEAAGVDADVVRALNPHLVKDQTPPGRTFGVRIPQGSGPSFAADFGAGAERA